MQGSDNRKWSEKIGIDGVIIILAICVFVTAVTLLITDSHDQPNVGTDFTPIGHFVKSKNDVRRRVETGFSWGNVSKTDQVYEGDSVFTGEDSAAHIELDQGGALSVEPNSLVVVRTRGSGAQFDLQYGSLFGKVADGQSLFITNNGETQEITGQDAEFQIMAQGPGKETKVQVLRGEISLGKVSKVDGAKPAPKAKIKKDEVADIASSGVAVVKKPEIALVSPKTGSTFWLSLAATADFSWKRTGSTANQPVKFEMARDADFKDVVVTKSLNADSISLAQDQRPEGSFFWRVAPGDAKQISLPTLPSRVSLLSDEPPLPRQPTDRQELAFNSQMSEKGKAVMMSWEDKAGSTDFEVEVAKDEAFSQIVYKKKIEKTPSDNSNPLPAGTYYWHVKGLHAERKNAPWSRLSSFVILDDAKVPAKPTLLSSDLKFEIPAEAFKGATPAQLGAGEAIPVEAVMPFMWRTAADADSYEIELADSPEFKNATKVQAGEATTYSLPKVKPGTVYARVRGVTKKGFAGEPSEPAKLVVSVSAPTLEKIPEVSDTFTTQAEFDSSRREISLNWTARPYAKAYELQWAADPQFKKLKKYKIDGTKRTQVVNVPMNYYTRVRALDANTAPISAFSAVKVASYKKVLKIPAPAPAPIAAAKKPTTTARTPSGVLAASVPRPVLLEPQLDSSVITLENSKSFVNFRWKPVAQTDEYQVQIADDPDFEHVVGEIKTKNTRSIFQKRLPEGKVYWRVRSMTKKGYSAWSNAFHINVLYE